MTRVTIAVAQRPYEAWIENGLLSRAGTLLREILPGQNRLFVVTFGPVRRKWGRKLTASLEQAQLNALLVVKTGVNLRAGKNLLGTFHQPRAVLIDPAVLATLPEREFHSGLYEALKCAVIGNPDLFHQFEQNKDKILKRDPASLERIITDSVHLKASVVSADERENGLRRVLNFGHTIGHALEAETGYRRLLHGEAVAWGMLADTKIALSVGRTVS